MNSIKAKLVGVKSLERLNLLEFKTQKNLIRVVILEMNLDLKIGSEAILYVKPTKCYLLPQKAPFENCIEVEVLKIDEGEILTSVICRFEDFEMEVVMLKDFVNFDQKAFLVFKASDIFISEVTNEA
jgi:molybdopterin-binding protein